MIATFKTKMAPLPQCTYLAT